MRSTFCLKMPKSITLSIVLLTVLGVCTWGVQRWSRMSIEPASTSRFGTIFDGSGDDYRELLACAERKLHVLHRGPRSEIVLRACCIPKDQPGTKVGPGGFEPTGESKVVWTGGVWEKANGYSSQTTVRVEYDLKNEIVTLLNSGEKLPLDPSRIYAVLFDERFKVAKFLAVDPARGLPGVHPKVTDYFRSVSEEERKTAEHVVGSNRS